VRPALVGGVWASICIYTYRYLLPFNEAEMPIEQIVFYVTSIALIAGTIVTWLIAGRVVHPLAYRLRVSKMLRRSASAQARAVPAHALAGARRHGARRTTHSGRVPRRERLDRRHRMDRARGAAAPRVGRRARPSARGASFALRRAPGGNFPFCRRGESCAESSEQAA
jgi:hypothetical protein